MKKRIMALCLLLALILCTAGCGQQAANFEIPHTGVSMVLPEGMEMFTRGMAEDDPILAKYKTNSQGVDRGLSGKNSYVYLFDEDMTFGVDVCRMSSKTDDYRDLDEEGRKTLIQEYTDSMPADSGAQVELLEFEDQVFIHYQLPVEGGYLWQWATNCNDQLIYVTLSAAEESVGLAQHPWIQEMLKSMTFRDVEE